MWTYPGCDIVFHRCGLMWVLTTSLLICVESVLVNHHLCWEPGRFMVGLLVLHLLWSLFWKESNEITLNQWGKQAQWWLCLSCTIAMPCVKFCVSVSRGLQGSAAAIGTIIGVTSEAETTFLCWVFFAFQHKDLTRFTLQLCKCYTWSPWCCILELVEIPQSILRIICMGEIKRIF